MCAYTYKLVKGGEVEIFQYICLFFVLLCVTNFMNKLKYDNFKKRRRKKIIKFTNVLLSTKSPHFPLRGMVGQLSKRKRLLCWLSIFLVCGWDTVQHHCICLRLIKRLITVHRVPQGSEKGCLLFSTTPARERVRKNGREIVLLLL